MITLRNLAVPLVGLLMVAAGVLLPGLGDSVAIALIVVGAGMFLIGTLLPVVSEFEIGPGGFSAKLREQDEEVHEALSPDAQQLAGLATWLAGGRGAGQQLAERALVETYLDWPTAREDPRLAARKNLVDLVSSVPAAVGAETADAALSPDAHALLRRMASLPINQRLSAVLNLLDGQDVDQIARLLGQSQEAVSAELTGARQALAAALS